MQTRVSVTHFTAMQQERIRCTCNMPYAFARTLRTAAQMSFCFDVGCFWAWRMSSEVWLPSSAPLRWPAMMLCIRHSHRQRAQDRRGVVVRAQCSAWHNSGPCERLTAAKKLVHCPPPIRLHRMPR